ncbi:hypothetical protein CYLTODRAFT_436248 [Cylindrobasidium torrendii FP15055 ss-10]|uniref:THUMP domain-containing protein n=1 Tax=Cylindrobasidium torrendii FP15055 ss-10 TaxID=1314674 RepID=A0A0D7BG85_9AGAR|nr:hypothetical protein CYLTODRAFT_436248 [Cylindrobasidium torrendii FP15055 ss-10]
MAGKRNSESTDRQTNNKKRRFHSDGTPVWGNRIGPGVWVTCVKGKERQAVGELHDLFDSLASELWPEQDANLSEEDEGLSIEEQIKKELSTIKKPGAKKRFVNLKTDTTCAIFISCRPPVDPVTLIETHIANVQKTGIARTKFCHRFVPVSASCVTNIPEIQGLCRAVLDPWFAKEPERKFTYKIEIRTRNHTNPGRDILIKTVAACVPEVHTVNLTNPEVFILVEVFKSTFSISVTKEYYNLLKYNVVEIAARYAKEHGTSGEEPAKPQTDAA